MQPSAEVWDDTEIVNAFHNAIANHRCRNEDFDENAYNASRTRKRKLNGGDVNGSVSQMKSSKPIDIWNDNSNNDNTHNSGEEHEVANNEGAVGMHGLPSCDPSACGGPDPTEYLNSMTAQTLRKLGSEAGEGNAVLEEALSSMMMAWYQSGYATGRYHTLLEASKQTKKPVSEIGASASASCANRVAPRHASRGGDDEGEEGEMEEGELSS